MDFVGPSGEFLLHIQCSFDSTYPVEYEATWAGVPGSYREVEHAWKAARESEAGFVLRETLGIIL